MEIGRQILGGTSDDEEGIATLRVRVLSPGHMWDEARAAYRRTGGGERDGVAELLGTRERPDLDACLRELVGDAVATDSFEIV